MTRAGAVTGESRVTAARSTVGAWVAAARQSASPAAMSEAVVG
jgi:hypothetical protein